MNTCKLFIYPLAALIAHQSCDRHRHLFDHLSFFYKDNPAFLRNQAVYCKFHLFVIDSDHDNIVRIMRNRQCHSTLFDSISF